MPKTRFAFSILELSIVILIIGILIAGLARSGKLVRKMRISSAITQTQSSPVSGTMSLVLWLESVMDGAFTGDLAGIDLEDNNKIQVWNDQNTQSNFRVSVSQNSEDNKPIYLSNSINNLPAVKFDGIDDFLRFKNICSQNFSIFVVLKTELAGNDGEAYTGNPILWSDVSGNAQDMVPFSIGGGHVKIGTGMPDNTLTGGITINDGAPHIISITRNLKTGSRKIYVDGVADNSDNASTAVLNANPEILLGGNIIDGIYYDGFIGEVIIFESVLSGEDRKAIEAYLGKKWKVRVAG